MWKSRKSGKSFRCIQKNIVCVSKSAFRFSVLHVASSCRTTSTWRVSRTSPLRTTSSTRYTIFIHCSSVLLRYYVFYTKVEADGPFTRTESLQGPLLGRPRRRTPSDRARRVARLRFRRVPSSGATQDVASRSGNVFPRRILLR